MLRVLTDPAFGPIPTSLRGYSSPNGRHGTSRATLWAQALLEGNENLRKRPPGCHRSASAPRGFPPTRSITTTARPCFPSGCCSRPALRDDVSLPREVREAAPALADLCDIRAALGRERWRKAGRHLCAATWLGEQTPTDKLLEKAVDDWNSPTDMKLIIQSLERRRTHRAQGPLAETGRHPLLGGPTDRGGPGRGRTLLVCVASVLGHVDEATGKRMSA